MGTLYVVGTPIGNLQDMTPRAIDTLGTVDLIAAEDTRHSGNLMRHFGITTPMISYHQHNIRERETRLLDALIEGDVALISDAGTPAIADPGQELVAAALAANHRVVPVPGASALIAAVSASGLVAGPFLSLGFIDRRGDARRVQLGRAVSTGYPIVLFEAPNRLIGTLEDIVGACGEREVVVARELTKLHEEIRRGLPDALIAHFRDVAPRGEFVVVIGPGNGEAHELSSIGSVERLLRDLLRDGLKPSRAARAAAEITGLPGADLYEIVRRLTKEERPS